MEIMLGLDNNYVSYCCVLITSFCENNLGEEHTFFILSDGFTKENELLLTKTVKKYNQKIRLCTINTELLANAPIENPHLTISTFYRILAPLYIPNNVDKILYLDCDIIVRHSLQQLWNTDISNYAIGAVTDCLSGDIKKYNSLQYDYSLGYINAGVLLINLKYWRENDVTNRILSFINEHPERLQYEDQCAINYVLRNEKKFLPIKFNVQNPFFFKEKFLCIERKYWNEIFEAIRDPYILHYTSCVKPWHKECEHPLKYIFFDYSKRANIRIHLKYRNKKDVLKRYIRYLLQIIGLVSAIENVYKTKNQIIQQPETI